MRELQVHAAGVNVELRAEQLVGHRGAFDVPARPALAPRRRPVRLTRLRLLPQHEVERIAFRLVDRDARARAQIAQLAAGQLAVVGKAGHRVHHVAVRRDVRVTLVDQLFDHRDDAGHVLRGLGLDVRPQQAEPVVVLVHRLREAARERLHALAVLLRAIDDVVVDVRDVADEGHLVAAILEIAAHDVERGLRPRMAHVAEVVDRIAAQVHAHHAGLERFEFFFATCVRVEDLHCPDFVPRRGHSSDVW